MSLARIAGGSRRAGDFRRLGDRYRDDRRWPEAAEYYRRHLQTHEADFPIWVQLGNCLKEAASYEEALEAYNRAIGVNGRDSDVYLQRGHLEKLMGRAPDAIVSYRTSLEIQPHNNEALRELLTLGARAEAAEALRAARDAERAEEGEADRRQARPIPARRGRRARTAKRPRVLYISDSFGTPIHARGIYYYSMAMTEMLASLGLDLTLVVEWADGYGVERGIFRNRSGVMAESVNSCFLADIYRYFTNNIFSFSLKFRWEPVQSLFERHPGIVRFFLRLHNLFVRRRRMYVRNEPGAIDFLPGAGPHLRKFGGFLYMTKFYSEQLSRAVTGLGPLSISAAGYDAVIIDTPHYVRVRWIRRSRIFTVVHDLIPLRDPFMWAEWRNTYLAKLKSTLATKGNLIFVSEYTRALFHAELPRATPSREVVIYPTIRRDQTRAFVAARGRSYRERIAAQRRNERRRQIAVSAGDATDPLVDDPEIRTELLAELEKTILPWEPDLPYFVTIVSDEPRKNIRMFRDIAPHFIGRCNFIVVGQVDGNSYMRHQPELYPNLHFTGYITDEDKEELLRSAAGLIFPSYSEGFGIPIVEGALVGIPILCSNIEVFREIAGNLAGYFDPYSVEELAFRIDQLLQDPASFAAMAERLRTRVAGRFSQREMRPRLRKILGEVGVLTAPEGAERTDAAAAADEAARSA